MAKTFRMELLGTKTAVVCGADKAVTLAERLFTNGYSTLADKNDLIANANKFSGKEYAVNLTNGKFGKTSLYIKKGFTIKKYNDCLEDKVETFTAPLRTPDSNNAGVNHNDYVRPTYNNEDDMAFATPTTKTTKKDGGITMKKGTKTMMEKVFGTMGFVSTDEVRLTSTGKLAFFDKTRDRWLSENDGNLVDNLGLVMDFKGAFAMPVKKEAIKIGDLIITPAGNYGFVETVEPLKILTKTASVSTIREVGNILGMETFITVIRPIFDNTVEGFNPMLFALMGDDNKGEGLDMKKMMLMNMMSGTNGTTDPMALMMLMGEDTDIKEVLIMQAMAKSGNADPTMLMMMLGDNKEFDMKEFMVMQSMTGGKAIDPTLMLLLDDSKEFDMQTMLMMQMMNPNGGTGLDMNNPLMMMAMFDKKKGGNGKMKDIMTMMMMTGAMGKNADGTPKAMDFSNPMTMMMLMGDDNMDMKDMMMMQAMSGQAGATGTAGAMNPMMLMMMLGDKKGGKGMDMKDMMMMQMMGGQAGTAGAMNPMMMAMMLKK
ncbi:MAG: hypothetical protein RR744_00210 [Cellulosilyticaceae bacterium]